MVLFPVEAAVIGGRTFLRSSDNFRRRHWHFSRSTPKSLQFGFERAQANGQVVNAASGTAGFHQRDQRQNKESGDCRQQEGNDLVHKIRCWDRQT
jgi:hypothetical protein